MSLASPTIEGFRAAFRRPSLTFAEMAWRWTVGGAAWTLFLFLVVEYLDTLPVTHGDVTLLRTRQPVLIGRAIAHIFRGSLNRAVLASLLAALALTLLWIIAASFGRAVTVRALFDYFRRDVAGNVPTSNIPSAGSQGLVVSEDAASSASTEIQVSLPLSRRVIRALIALNFLRITVALASIFAFVGAAILAGFASPAAKPRPGMAFILFLPFAALICTVWPALNWLLSIASIFAIRDGDDALDAMRSAVTFSRERSGSVFAVSTWNGFAHLIAISVAGTAVSVPLAFVQIVPGRLILAAIALLMLAYFAIVDWLYLARLAGYVCIAETPDVLPTPASLAIAPPAGNGVLPQSAIDRDEPILSDLPNLVVET
ncbi:MAG: hypothetical protein ACYDDS_21025 [Candidatus Sulfotelmatobacter sp.]